jgi:hypothetical protein
MIESNTGQLLSDIASAEQQRMDRHLMTAAVQAMERLHRVCADWPADRVRELAFVTALTKLKFELSRESYESIRARYNARRQQFLARLKDQVVI